MLLNEAGKGIAAELCDGQVHELPRLPAQRYTALVLSPLGW